MLIQPGAELRDQAGLADPRLAEQRDELRHPLREGLLERRAQQGQVALPADHRRTEVADHVRAEARPGRTGLPAFDRAADSLGRNGFQRVVAEDATRRLVRAEPDDDRADRRGGLQAGREVDHHSGDERLAELGPRGQLDQRLTGLDADPDLQRPVRQGPHRLEDLQAGADRAFGVVLPGPRGAEDGQDGVPGELLDRPAVPLDRLPQGRVVRRQPAPDVLRVGGLGRGGEADEVAEQHRDDLAFLGHGASRSPRSAQLSDSRPRIRAVRALSRAWATSGFSFTTGSNASADSANVLSPSGPATTVADRGRPSISEISPK